MITKIAAKSKILEEIHLIREKITEETKDMSPKEEIEYWKKNLNKELNREGYKLIASSNGFHRIRKK